MFQPSSCLNLFQILKIGGLDKEAHLWDNHGSIYLVKQVLINASHFCRFDMQSYAFQCNNVSF